MGEIAEMMLDGTLCQVCGVFIDDEPPGYPCTCHGCKQDAKARERVALRDAPPVTKVKCPTCGKKLKAGGLADHQRDVHESRASGVSVIQPKEKT